MLTTLLGAIVCAVSGYGIIRWFPEFLTVLKGFVPVCFFFGGLIAVIVGLMPERKMPLTKSDKDKQNAE